MPPDQVKDSNKLINPLKEGPASTIQGGKDKPKDEPSSLTDALGLTPEQAHRLKLENEQSTFVYDEILSYLDWDHDHKDPKPEFKPFYFFCSKELRRQKPDIEQLVVTLKTHDASRLVGGKGLERGVAWEFNDEELAEQLQEGVQMQKPAMYLGYDMVTVDGTLRPCRVVCTL